MNKEAFVVELQQSAAVFLAAVHRLRAIQTQYNALDLGSIITDADMPAESGLTAADVIAAMSSIAAVEALLVQGHNTNLYKLKA